MAEGENETYTKCEKKGTKYINKWGDWPHGFYSGLPKLIKWMWSMGTKRIFGFGDISDDLPILKPNFNDKSFTDKFNIVVTWLGHASILIKIEGFTILCDPVFSETCGPFGGIKRYQNSPCKIEDLPDIDAVVISHNHYDHMDSETIKELSNRYKNLKWYIPDGDRKNLCSMIEGNINEGDINEMKWWDELEIAKSEKKLKVVFTPTQHWSNRGLFDAFKSLWGSYAFIGESTKFWFGGDTGYCPVFKQIGKKYGPFTGAAIPIGAYKPRDLLKFQHCDPSEAVQIHEDIQSDVSFGIHWGTFMLSEEGHMEPKNDLEKCVREKNGNKQNEDEKIKFITIKHGQTLLIENKNYKFLDQLENKVQN